MTLEPWLAQATHVASVGLDAWLRIEASYYYGTVNGFTRQDWATLREPVGVALPAEDGWLSATRALACVDDLVAHHRRLLEIGQRRGRPVVEGAAELWIRPRVVVDGASVASFPWIDSYLGTAGFFDAIRRDAEGTLFSDVDQDWELLVLREGDRIRIGERNDPFGDGPGRVITIDRPVLVEAATAARDRLDRLMDALAARLGRDLWGVRLARGLLHPPRVE